MNFSQMVEFEEQYRKVFLLPPNELQFIMEDLRGVEMTLVELAQILLDGGIGPEYLGEKYKTSEGSFNLLMVIACQDNLEVDFADLHERVEQYYDDLEHAFEDHARALQKEVTPGSTAAPVEDGGDSTPSSFEEEEEVVTLSRELEKGGPVIWTSKDKYGTHQGPVSTLGVWNPAMSIDMVFHSTPQYWGARVMPFGHSESTYTTLDATIREPGFGPPVPWDMRSPRPNKAGFTPKQWLSVVRSIHGTNGGGSTDTLRYLRAVWPDISQTLQSTPRLETNKLEYSRYWKSDDDD
jgi:hypothetical protein